MNRQLKKYLEEYILDFSLTDTESEQARVNLATVTSGYHRGRDPKLIAWTACNMVLKRRRDGSDSKARSESLGLDPKKVAQIEWRIVKAQTNRGEMPPDKKSEWVDFEKFQTPPLSQIIRVLNAQFLLEFGVSHYCLNLEFLFVGITFHALVNTNCCLLSVKNH